VAAGDGALSSKLGMAGIKVHSTDNKSWDKNINPIPKNVIVFLTFFSNMTFFLKRT
jgi:hypothetical protein